jgi:hypothetical protein
VFTNWAESAEIPAVADFPKKNDTVYPKFSTVYVKLDTVHLKFGLKINFFTRMNF